MKNPVITALSLVLLPLAAMAQTNIKQAYDNIIDCPKAEIVQNHSLEKDPKTGRKESQCDAYQFTMPKKQMPLITALQEAFLKDSENAYKYANGKRRRDDTQPIALSTGNGTSGVVIGKEPGMNYTYACFLAPEDSTGTHRYAYAMEWKETSNGDYLVGTLYVTYATTQKYRMENSPRLTGFKLKDLKDLENLSDLEDISGLEDLSDLKDKVLRDLHELGKRGGIELNDNGGLTIGGATYFTPPTWFDTLTSYITALTTADLTTRRALASKIYTHTKNLKNVDARDKETARELLKALLSNKHYDDAIIQQLLNSALINIK